MTNIINIKDKSFEYEIKRIMKKNNNNGYHSIIGIINSMRTLGKTDNEILEALRKL